MFRHNVLVYLIQQNEFQKGSSEGPNSFSFFTTETIIKRRTEKDWLMFHSEQKSLIIGFEAFGIICQNVDHL